jgi:hypothetical protein
MEDYQVSHHNRQLGDSFSVTSDKFKLLPNKQHYVSCSRTPFTDLLWHFHVVFLVIVVVKWSFWGSSRFLEGNCERGMLLIWLGMKYCSEYCAHVTLIQEQQAYLPGIVSMKRLWINQSVAPATLELESLCWQPPAKTCSLLPLHPTFLFL